METKGMKRLSGEELLVMRVMGIVSPKSIERELDQRAINGAPTAAPQRRCSQRRAVLMAAA